MDEASQPTPEAKPQPDLHEELRQMREKWLHARADLENYRKRVQARVQDQTRQAEREVLFSFLEVLDSLQRALESQETAHDEWAQGTKAILKQMLDKFKQHDVKPFRCLGKRFDPGRHEAVDRIYHAKEKEGTIVEVIQTGYHCRDGHILRPAKVIVSTRDPEGAKKA